jgi:D-sedoheptulose 7-phosphate isomerase
VPLVIDGPALHVGASPPAGAATGIAQGRALALEADPVPVPASAPRGEAGGSAIGTILRAHVADARDTLAWLGGEVDRLAGWAERLASVLTAGGRALVAGNGGSAALAQHLTSELVGRYQDERPPFSAIALTAETSALTALANDYGFDECFARQVSAHGRPGDIFVGLSSSGRSPNLLRAVDAARARGLCCWSMTGARPNPLAEASDDVLAVPARLTATVQEVQQVAVHVLCRAFDHRIASWNPTCPPSRLAPRSPECASQWPATRS